MLGKIKYLLFLFPISNNEILNEVNNSKSKYIIYINDLNMLTIKDIIIEINPLLK